MNDPASSPPAEAAPAASRLSPDAQALWEAVVDGRRLQWPIEELEVKYLQALPHMRSRPERRREFATVIAELVAAGRVRASARLNRSQLPPLPTFVRLIRPAKADDSAGRLHGWRPELADILRLTPKATAAELKHARRVNRWLAASRDSPSVCGSRERSLEVFGDEKLLDERLRYSRLFTAGLLSYELLRARRVAPGLVSEIVGSEPIALVVENTDTFRSVADVLRELPHSPVGAVVWGAGAAFEQSCDYLRDLRVGGVALRQGFYFGDVDPSGVRIPARASRLLLPLPLAPALPLYELLMALGRRGPARERFTESTREYARWLGEPLASEACEVMQSGVRIAQEALTADTLRAHPAVLSGA